MLLFYKFNSRQISSKIIIYQSFPTWCGRLVGCSKNTPHRVGEGRIGKFPTGRQASKLPSKISGRALVGWISVILLKLVWFFSELLNLGKIHQIFSELMIIKLNLLLQHLFFSFNIEKLTRSSSYGIILTIGFKNGRVFGRLIFS